MHRQELDDVGSVVAGLVSVAEQFRSDRVAVGLVADQDAADSVAGLRVQCFEQRSKVGVVIAHDPSSAFNVR